MMTTWTEAKRVGVLGHRALSFMETPSCGMRARKASKKVLEQRGEDGHIVRQGAIVDGEF